MGEGELLKRADAQAPYTERFGSGVVPGRVENHWSKSPRLRGTRADSGLTEAGTAILGKQLVGGRQAGCVFEAAS